MSILLVIALLGVSALLTHRVIRYGSFDAFAFHGAWTAQPLRILTHPWVHPDWLSFALSALGFFLMGTNLVRNSLPLFGLSLILGLLVSAWFDTFRRTHTTFGLYGIVSAFFASLAWFDWTVSIYLLALVIIAGILDTRGQDILGFRKVVGGSIGGLVATPLLAPQVLFHLNGGYALLIVLMGAILWTYRKSAALPESEPNPRYVAVARTPSINELLDKVGSRGMRSLSKEEKAALEAHARQLRSR